MPVREKLLKNLTALRALQARRLNEIVAAADDLVLKFHEHQAVNRCYPPFIPGTVGQCA